MSKSNQQSSSGSGALASAAVKARLTLSELGSIRAWLMEQLAAQEYAKLGQGGHTQNQVPLRRVFVDLPASDNPNPTRHDTQRILFLDKLLSAEPIELSSLFKDSGVSVQDQNDSIEKTEPELPRTNTRDVRRRRITSYSGTLLIGGPGQGKSTLGQLASSMPTFLVLDGFDEVGAALDRERLVTAANNLISVLASRNAASIILATTRPASSLHSNVDRSKTRCGNQARLAPLIHFPVAIAIRTF